MQEGGGNKLLGCKVVQGWGQLNTGNPQRCLCWTMRGVRCCSRKHVWEGVTMRGASKLLKGRCTVLTRCAYAMFPCRCLFTCPPMAMEQLQTQTPLSPPFLSVNLSGCLTAPA